ncbi:MAG TPA: 6-pyruvoyl-tetrahydropterin synthase-related protein [Candidatus Acidoferrum sp.]|nr:6-pyruvoyl-tetrahydropterin synthase-related protein [Candidatus Acidoferrum sp.]
MAGPSSASSRAGLGWFPALLISLLLCLLIVLPFFRLGNPSGHDFQFHTESWLDVAGQWRQGVLYPRWSEWADYGYGEPRYIFYPPGSWMLGAALGMVLPWKAVPGVFIVLVQTLAGLGAFFLARRMLSQRGSLFCAACYAANPYALLNIYLRSDFAELLADAFFPLLFLAALELCEMFERPSPAVQRPDFRNGAAFAFWLALIWLSNAPAGVIASYSSALLFVFVAFAARSWKPLSRGAGGLALGLGLACFYLLPAGYEQRWVNISQALSTGLLPSENFLYTQINAPEHTFFNFIASTAAVLLMVLTGLAALRGREREENARGGMGNTLWHALLLLAAVATFLMLHVSALFWTLLPKLRFVQFPWRWMSLLALPFALFLAAAITRRRWEWAWALSAFACIGAAGVFMVRQAWWDTQDIPALQKAIAEQSGYDGTDEYDPIGDDHTNIPVKSPRVQVMDTDTMQGPVKKPTVTIVRWRPEEKEVSVQSALPFYLGIRVLNYPAWRVEIKGKPVTARGGEDYNEMVVPIPPGDSVVRVRFVRTWDRIAGGLASLASALLLAWLTLRRKAL